MALPGRPRPRPISRCPVIAATAASTCQPWRSDGPGVLVMEASGDSRQLALSADGESWTDLPATALPATFQIGGIAGTGTELVAAGDNGKDPAGPRSPARPTASRGRRSCSPARVIPRKARREGGCSSPRTAFCWTARPRTSPAVTCGGRGPTPRTHGSLKMGTRRSGCGRARAKAPDCFRTALSPQTGRICSRCGRTVASSLLGLDRRRRVDVDPQHGAESDAEGLLANQGYPNAPGRRHRDRGQRGELVRRPGARKLGHLERSASPRSHPVAWHRRADPCGRGLYVEHGHTVADGGHGTGGRHGFAGSQGDARRVAVAGNEPARG